MTERRPVATVAMVTWNSSRYVAQAIESVLAQTLADLELVICDDASTDDTWDIVRRYADPRIRAFRNPRNLGEYANRNRALSLARGEFLIFIDGDDYLYPHGLEFMARHLAAYPRAAFAAALPWIEQLIYPVELSPHDYYASQFLGPNVTGRDFTQLLFRAQALRAAGGFDPRFRTGDTHIQFVLGAAAPVLLTSDGVAWWRRTPGQASEALLATHLAMSEWTAYSLELLARPGCPLDAAERRIATANVCGRMLRTALRYAMRGRIAHAWRLLRASGMRLSHVRHISERPRRPFLGGRDGTDPLGPSSALPPPVAGIAVDREDRLDDAFPRAEVVDRPPARGDQVPVVEDHVAADR
jgi:hypothetical protein